MARIGTRSNQLDTVIFTFPGSVTASINNVHQIPLTEREIFEVSEQRLIIGQVARLVNTGYSPRMRSLLRTNSPEPASRSVILAVRDRAGERIQKRARLRAILGAFKHVLGLPERASRSPVDGLVFGC